MAQQSIVLLKNEHNTLPLRKNIRKIVVLGPNADNNISVLGNYNGTPSKITTLLNGIREKTGSQTEVVYEKAVNFTNDTLLAYADISTNCSFDGKKGFRAEYFNNKELEGSPAASLTETTIDHFWQEGQLVTGAVRANNFSTRYTTNYTADKDGSITLEVEADDGYRLFVDDKEVLNAWTRNRWGARTYKLNTEKNKTYKLVLEYWQGEGKGNVRLRAGNFEQTNYANLLERVKDADVILFAGGISPQLEGEEMRVDYPGFNGGDRTSIMLPAVQTELMKKLQASGKPVVFVMMTGSAIAIPWENEHIPAIINAWYGGQSAGTAIADVLFGDYNPAGRLPVTFYKSDADLPSFMSYDMSGRTYRYFTGEALYPFGYGLSYTSFRYDALSIPATANRKGTLKVTVRVTNSGKADGDEVVQLYISHPGVKGKAPVRQLKGFQRINLKAGASRLVSFTLTPEQFSLINEADGQSYIPSGKLMLSVGGGQPGVKNNTTSNVLTKTINVQ
jgi:beta-glucosidase